MGDFLDQSFGSQLGEVITQGGQAVVVDGGAQGLSSLGVEFCGGKGVTGSDMGEAQQGMHEGELPGMIQFQAGNALAVGQQGRLAELAELAPIDEGFQDVLLPIEVVVDDRGELLLEFWEMIDAFLDGIVGHVCGEEDDHERTV